MTNFESKKVNTKFQCKSNEFTCNDGTCLDLEVRCNDKLDCSDESDEDNCEPIYINKRSYRKIFPPTFDLYKTEISIIMDIRSITKIDEMAMTFEAEVHIHLSWRDRRIEFQDLKIDGTFLNKTWQDQIWLPPLYFSNAAGNIPISSGDTVGVKVLKQGIPNLKNAMELNEGKIFLGKENDLELNSKHEGLFRCNYKLSNFPFDTQRCSINIKVPNEIKNFTNINPKQLIYSGTNSLIKLL